VSDWRRDENFGFDQAAWRRWFAAQKKSEPIDARRGLGEN
jgi:hypothetical protein